jgi:hypothetical protein
MEGHSKGVKVQLKSVTSEVKNNSLKQNYENINL